MRFIIFILVMCFLLSCSDNPTSPDPEPQPGNPYNMQIEQLSTEAVKLTWELPEINNNTLVIYRKTGEANWDHEYIELNSGSTSFIDSIYTQAFIVYSYFLTEISDSLIVGTSDTVAFFSDNSLPTEFQLEHIKQDSIRISWHDNSFGEFFYGIDKKIGNGNWIEEYIVYEPDPANGHNSDMSYVDYNSSLSDSIYYRIYLMNGISKSIKTNSSIYSSLLPPSNLKATIDGDGIKLTWIDNYQTETGFIIERKIYGNEYEQIELTGANSQSFLDEELDTNEIYFYRIKVIVNELQSNYSDTVIGCVEHEGKWVPLDFDTIQAAIDATNSFSQIVILPGTYYENVLIQDKYPEFKSLYSLLGDEEFIELTVIDGSMNGSAIAFVNCDLDDPSITGLTLQNGSGKYADTGYGGYYYSGGGLLCENSHLDVSSTVICNNISEAGGGIACVNSSYINITNSQIINNTSLLVNGGGMYINNSAVTIHNSLISENSTSHWGGGLFITNSSADITYSSFNHNSATIHGGGIYISSGSDVLLEDLSIIGNNAGSTGGGIRSANNDPVFRNLIISENTARDGGGIAFGSTQDPTFENILIFNNTAVDGGGIHTSSVDVNISNLTVYGNTASFGGGLYSRHYADPVVENCIFWGNSPEQIMIRPGNQPSNEGTVTISYSNIQDGIAGVSALYANDIIWLSGNINSDPLFQNPMINFHLQNNSPCIDAGNPLPEYNDPDGSRNDMGAYGGQNGDW